MILTAFLISSSVFIRENEKRKEEEARFLEYPILRSVREGSRAPEAQADA